MEVSVRSTGSMKLISIADVPFVTVTQNDAFANQTTVERLAKVWAKNLERGLKIVLGQH
ncbi:MAG: hypothetical protein RMK94_08445 [Armatimonadota bacterium]|nr:hypothetical protein [Armatimonadota bacterium]